MGPVDYYFLALALIVMPLLPFSRSAAVVGFAWLPGQFAYLVHIDPAVFDMVTAIMAVGAGLGIAANNRDRLVALSYIATAVIAALMALHSIDPYYAWWDDYWIAMARVLFLPATVNWGEIRRVIIALRECREFNSSIWRRALCW